MLSSTVDAIIASLGEVLIPLPTLSNILTKTICQADDTTPVNGLTRDEMVYPTNTNSFFFPVLSDQIPLKSLSIEAVVSATPSIIPRSIAPDPRAAIYLSLIHI